MVIFIVVKSLTYQHWDSSGSLFLREKSEICHHHVEELAEAQMLFKDNGIRINR